MQRWPGLLKRTPRRSYDLIENMTAHHNDWDTSAQRNESSSSITSSNPEIASLKLQMEEMNRNLTRVLQTNQQVNTVTPSCETCGGPHSYNDCPATVGQNQNVYAVGAYNQGGNSYQPQGNRNLLSYRSDNYLGPPGFNVNQNQNRSNQNQNNQVQPYQNRNQGNNQSNNQGRNQFFQGANHNQNQVQNYQAPNTQPPVALPQELTNYIRINENKINSMQTQMNNLATSNQRLESMLGNFIKMNTASSSGTGSLPSNTVANPKGELKAITTRSGLVLDEPSVPMPPPFINPEEDERVEETFTDPEHGEFTIKVPPPLVQKAKQRNFVIHQRDPRHPNIPYPSRMNQEKQKEKDDVQIHKFWQMFKQLHINITLADALILIPKYQKMLKSLLSNKEKLIELANTPVSENCSAVILKKLPEKLGDPGKFLIPCGFSELKCKALADLGASINLMPLSVWKELGLPKLIPTQMTLELANRDICTPKGIARDVFVLVGKFTFPADFVIVDYESDPRVPLILGRPFLRTARALIIVHEEEMILRDGNERLILNMRNDTSSYSNEPHQESINMIDVYNVSHEEIHEDLFATNLPSGNPTSLVLTSPEVNDDIFDPEEDIIENLLNLDKTKKSPSSSSSSPTLISLEESGLIWEEFEAYLASDSFPPGNCNPSSLLPPFHNSLSGSTTSSSPSLHISKTSDYSLEEFADELAHITFPPGNDDLPFDAESDLLELEYLLNHDPIKDMDSILEDSVDENSLDDNLDDTISEMFTDEHALDYSSPPLWDDYDDNLFDHETVNDDTYDDPFDFKEEKIKESKLLIDELDLPESNNVLPFPEYDSVFYEDFSKVDALSSTNNEDKVFNPGILIHENLFEVTNFATPDKNVKKTTNASLILEDFNPPLSLYELPFHKEVPGLGALLSFSSENEEKVYNLGILTSKRVHTSLFSELSHRGTKAFKVTKILKSPMEIFPCSYQEDIRSLDVPCFHLYPP
ncbi:reverse transcriptase domain-containing protein [Tanacetum coccineum]|uniref:Reverse transcriptase domain-containing protein n=1 Tax=Tanacetum coccineum TaxID=301880 RepID=A0ABQ5DHZ0_9ASTR